MITLKNIEVTFSPQTIREKKALFGLNLSIQEGQFVTVIGSNGAGKSTLLNTISGEALPSKGQIFMDDQDVTFLPSHKRAALVARVFQDPLAGTCGELTVAENMCLAEGRGQRRGLKWALQRTHRTHYKALLKNLNLGLEDRIDTPMALLSGGQRQAVSLVMASLSPLKILLLDEHTSALDPRTAAFVLALTERLIQEKGLTVLMVTHSLQQALHLGHRTIMLHEGRIIYDVEGTERAGLTAADLMEQFGPSMDDDRILLQG